MGRSLMATSLCRHSVHRKDNNLGEQTDSNATLMTITKAGNANGFLGTEEFKEM